LDYIIHKNSHYRIGRAGVVVELAYSSVDGFAFSALDTSYSKTV
jgi:hypothetical protein